MAYCTQVYNADAHSTFVRTNGTGTVAVVGVGHARTLPLKTNHDLKTSNSWWLSSLSVIKCIMWRNVQKAMSVYIRHALYFCRKKRKHKNHTPNGSSIISDRLDSSSAYPLLSCSTRQWPPQSPTISRCMINDRQPVENPWLSKK